MTKQTKEEAAFQEGRGDLGWSCDGCKFYTAGVCEKVNVKPKPDDLCKLFEPRLDEGKVSAAEAVVPGGIARVEMYITRVAKDPQTGLRRWFATDSGIDRDLYGERMSMPLFKDFIRRIENREEPPEPFKSRAWNGGLPYLGVAHYLDLNGEGIVGPTDQVWVDGDILKSRGTFAQTPLADAAYEAIRSDIEAKRPAPERVRISIAFIDWGHDHEGKGVFTRKSLLDRCSYCDAKAGDKVYKAGHLVHLALTRKPAYPDTTIALEERSMSSKRDDAASIVGDELADELEKKSKGMVVRSELIDPAALVVKADKAEGESGTVTAEMPAEEPGDPTPLKGASLAGAVTLDEAEAFLAKSEPGVLLDSWGILTTVLTNIAGEDKRIPITKAVTDFQGQLDVMAVKALLDVQKALNAGVAPSTVTEAVKPEVPVAEVPAPAQVPPSGVPEELHPLDEAIVALRTAYDEAVVTPIARGERLRMIQPSIEGLADVIRRGVDEYTPPAPAPGDAGVEAIVRAVEAAVAPLRAEIAALRQTQAPVERSGPRVPERRAVRTVGLVPGPTVRKSVTDQPPVKPMTPLTRMIRRSVGIPE